MNNQMLSHGPGVLRFYPVCYFLRSAKIHEVRLKMHVYTNVCDFVYSTNKEKIYIIISFGINNVIINFNRLNIVLPCFASISRENQRLLIEALFESMDFLKVTI